MKTVVVTEIEYRKAPPIFEKAREGGWHCIPAPPGESELAEAIRRHGASHAVIGVDRYVEALYDALPRGGVLARFGVGHDGVDKQKATARGILCVNTPGVLDASVAEHTLGLMLAAARHTVEMAAACRAHQWSPKVGTELLDKRLAVIGCGPIGCRVAQMAFAGFGMRVVGSEIREVDEKVLRQRFGFERVVKEFSAAVEGAEFVSLHIPSAPQTRHFINRDRLAQIPAGAWLINTARGAVVDEAALFDALKGGSLCGAALDVLECEPYAPVDPARDLRSLSNVILTPHVGSSTREACACMAERALRNIALAEARNFSAMDLLNPEVLK